jgi:hypothetical protein
MIVLSDTEKSSPDLGVVPPLVKRGNPDFGLIRSVDAQNVCGCRVVSLPPGHGAGRLLAGALGHETAARILHADIGLTRVCEMVFEALNDQNLGRAGQILASEWMRRHPTFLN